MTLTLELYLVLGLPIPIGSTGSFEKQERINLLDPEGFSIGENGWIPKLGQVRNDGVYTDSAATEVPDTLLAANIGRVIETMNLNAHGASPQSRYFLEQKLLRFADAARKFHISNYQTEPVYLHWRGVGAAGPQFALVYNIAIAQNNDPTVVANVDSLTITITREPEWLWEVPPGASPRIWTMYAKNLTPSAANYALDASNPIFSQEIAAASYHPESEIAQWQSHVTIPASDIPGDRPALLQLRLDGEFYHNEDASYDFYVHEAWIARSTRKTYGFLADHLRLPVKTNSGGGGAHIVGATRQDTSYQTDYGALDLHSVFGLPPPEPYTAPDLHNRARCTFATSPTVFAYRMHWQLNSALYTGRYAVFMRGHQSGGALGDIEIYLQYGYDYDIVGNPTTGIVNPLVKAVETHTKFWPLNFLGTITLPPDASRFPAGVDGLGADTDLNFRLHLWARRKVTPSELYIADLILMPIDECFVRITFARYGTVGSASAIYYDETRYLTRGRSEAIAFNDEFDIRNRNAEITGPGLWLEPGVDNRLYFLLVGTDGTSIGSPISADPGSVDGRSETHINVTGNLIPRSLGLRDS